MRARLVVFPNKGRNWCFSRSIDHSAPHSPSDDSRITLQSLDSEVVVDFISDKMNRAWMGLEKASEGSMKNKLHGFVFCSLSIRRVDEEQASWVGVAATLPE